MGSWGSQGQLAGGYQSGRLQPRQFCQSIQRPILIASIEHGCMNSVHCTLGFSALERESLNVFDHRGDARSALPPDTQLLSQQHRFSQFIDGLRDEHGRHCPMMERTNNRVGRAIRKTTVDECVNVDRRYSGKPVSHRRNYIGDKAAPNAFLRPKPNIVGTHQRRQEFYDRAPWGLPSNAWVRISNVSGSANALAGVKTRSRNAARAPSKTATLAASRSAKKAPSSDKYCAP